MILLDTHVLVWLAAEPRRLSADASRAIRKAAATGLGIASVSMWEAAVLFARGRIRGRGTVETSVRLLVEETGVVIREITPTIAALAAQLPPSFPKDPADRLIAATAMAEGIPLVTRDQGLAESGLVKTIW